MKKMMLLMLALCLLAGTALASTADLIYPLYDSRAEGDVFIGTAVSAGEGFFVSGGLNAIKLEKPYILTAEGKQYVSHLQNYTNGVAMMTTRSQKEAVLVSTAEPKGSLTLAACTEKGSFTQTCKVLYPVRWNGADCYLVQTGDSVSAGAALFNGNDYLVGVIVAQWGEGVNRYVMLPMGSFSGEEQQQPAATEEPLAAHQWLDDVQFTAEGHRLTITWTVDQLQDVREDSIVTVFIADADNSYYSWVIAKADEGSVILPITPGRTYEFAVQHAYGETVKTAQWRDHVTSVPVPAATPFTGHAYRDADIYLGTLPATEEGFSAEKAEPLAAVTQAALLDDTRSLFLQVRSEYVIEEEKTCDMLITLTTPDGTLFMELASYVFMVELQSGDVWNANLDPLLDEYLSLYKTFQPGTYAIDYYFDGQAVNHLTFTLE